MERLRFEHVHFNSVGRSGIWTFTDHVLHTLPTEQTESRHNCQKSVRRRSKHEAALKHDRVAHGRARGLA